MTTPRTRRAALLLGLLLVALGSTLFLLSPVRAQDTLVRIEIDAPVEPVPSGEEFGARVLVEDVDHLASFSFTIEYDPDRMSFERMDEVGQLLTNGEREQIVCNEPVTRENTVGVSCVTVDSPVCLGGPPGVSGSGLLGRVVFKAKGGSSGSTTLTLTETTLVLDDIEGCDLENVGAQKIAHDRENASVQLEGGGGGISGTIIGIIIGVVVIVVAGGGLGGFLWYRRRRAGTSP